MNRHKQLNIVKDHKSFFKQIEEYKTYKIKFEKDNIIKSKIQSFKYIVKGDNELLIIIITQSEYNFFVNNEFKELKLKKNLCYYNSRVKKKVL